MDVGLGHRMPCVIALFFFFNDPATTEIYTLPLHDALPIYEVAGGARKARAARRHCRQRGPHDPRLSRPVREGRDREMGQGDRGLGRDAGLIVTILILTAWMRIRRLHIDLSYPTTDRSQRVHLLCRR